MQEVKRKENIRNMFNAIAHRYDFLNHFLSLGFDWYWRKIAIKKLLKDNPQKVLDVATGTGDVAILTAKRRKEVQIVGVDISEKMIEIGVKKVQKKGLQSQITLQIADSEQLPFQDNSFDACVVAFGVRNFEHLEKGIQEIYRVLKPGRRVVILEFSQPTVFPFKQIYLFYFHRILPLMGNFISKDKNAYHYLPASVSVFPSGKSFIKILQDCGFKECSYTPLTFGVVTLYEGFK